MVDPSGQPLRSQLEVILPDGKIEFHDLDPVQGVATIGQHPENDIVLGGPEMAPHVARLDCSQPPFQVTLLSAEVEALLQGRPLPANVPSAVHDGDALQLAGYTLILLEGDIAAESAVPDLLATLRAVPADEKDELVVADLPKREWTVSVQETVVFEVTVANGGSLVAEFTIAVEGLDPGWVQVYPLELNLNEGGRATVTVAITPPRLAASRAGVHPLTVVVSSPTYPGHVSRMGAALTINPYYAFAVGDLSPRRQVIRRGQESGGVDLEIRNEGNCEASFLLEAEDDEHACRFEFQIAGETARLANQAQVVIAPEGDRPAEVGAATVRTIVTPKRRPLVALRSRTHGYTVTVSPGAGAEAARSLPGQVVVRPLIGPWLLALMTLAMAALIITGFWPQAGPLSADLQEVPLGARLSLRWQVSRFSQANISQGTAEPPFARADLPVGAVVITPAAPGQVTYHLEANNLLSRLSPQWFADWLQRLGERFRTRSTCSVDVLTPTPTPLPPPVIDAFSVLPLEIILGQSVDIEWAASDASSVAINSPAGTVEPGQGKAKHKPDDTGIYTYVLVAGNGTMVATRSASIGVTPPPTPTPTPQAPRITYFTLSRDTMVLGDSTEVKLSWEVEGDTTEITIKGTDIPDHVVPRKGEMPVKPSGAKNYMFVLTAKFGDLADSRTVQLAVLAPTATPTATPTPTPTLPAPQIIKFRVEAASPDQAGKVKEIAGSSACPGTVFEVGRDVDVRLVWEVPNLYPGDKVTIRRGTTLVREGQEGIGALDVPQSQIPCTFSLEVTSSRIPGGSTTRRLCILAQAPAAPYDLEGSPEPGGSIKLTWRYDAAQQSYILGFRVYRIDYGQNEDQFSPAGDIEALKRSWTDPEPGACDRGYYIVALYSNIDPSEPPNETAPSNSWYSLPCPD